MMNANEEWEALRRSLLWIKETFVVRVKKIRWRQWSQLDHKFKQSQGVQFMSREAHSSVPLGLSIFKKKT